MIPSTFDSHLGFEELERAVLTALTTYSNVHRGTGQYSLITTELFERARDIILDYLKLNNVEYIVIFCSPQRAEAFTAQLEPANYRVLSSQDVGLPLGVRALAVKKNALPKGIPFQTGGGMVKLVSPGSAVFSAAPDRFEAGTPSIINIIAFAKSLRLIEDIGNDVFKKPPDQDEPATADRILYQDEFLNDSGKELLLAIRKSFVGRELRVPVLEGKSSYTNLDNGASTPAFLPVWDTVCQAWKQPAHVQQKIVSEVKEICAEFLDAPLAEYDIIFSSNTTEALNIAAQNLARDFAQDTEIEPVILNTLLEHHSNELPWRFMPEASLIRVAVDDDGFVNLDDLERFLREYNQECKRGKKRIRLVALCGASNVLGSFNDIRTIAHIAHKYDARILVDGAQLAAHRAVSMLADGIDYLAFCGHKLYAPFGCGVLIARKALLNFDADELLQMKAFGEENTIGIAAMGKAITLLQRIGMDVIENEERVLTRRMLEGLSQIPGVKMFGVQDPNSARFQNRGGVVVFKLNGVPHNLAARELAEKGGIGVRDGCFCAHLIAKQLMRIQPLRGFAAEILARLFPRLVTSSILPGLIRVSIGLENDEQDIEHLLRILRKIASAPRGPINRFFAWTHNGTLFLPRTTIHKQMEAFSHSIIKQVYSNSALEK